MSFTSEVLKHSTHPGQDGGDWRQLVTKSFMCVVVGTVWRVVPSGHTLSQELLDAALRFMCLGPDEAGDLCLTWFESILYDGVSL